MNPSLIPYVVGAIALFLLGTGLKMLRNRSGITERLRGWLLLGQLLSTIGILLMGAAAMAVGAVSSPDGC